jgi:hypothetical protein
LGNQDRFKALLKFGGVWLSGQRKLKLEWWFSRMQKKMQKVERADLKKRMNSGFSKKFDSAPGHQKKFFLINRLEVSAKKSGPLKGRFFCFLRPRQSQFLIFVFGIDGAAVTCGCASWRSTARYGNTPPKPKKIPLEN